MMYHTIIEIYLYILSTNFNIIYNMSQGLTEVKPMWSLHEYVHTNTSDIHEN